MCVKKFCTTTQFDATTAHNSGFKAPFTLSEGVCVLSLSKDIALCITSLLIPKRMGLYLNRNKVVKSEFHLKPVRPLADEALTL